MRSAISSLAVLPLATLSLAAPQGSTVYGATTGKPGFVRVPLTYRFRGEEKFVTVDIGLGSPQQEVRVILNSGSNKLWVNPSCITNVSRSPFNDLRRENTEPYFMDASRNFVEVTLAHATDTLTLGPVEIKNQVVGVANEWQITGLPRMLKMTQMRPCGMMGVGRPNASDPDWEKSSVLRSLIKGNRINTEAFSVDVKELNGTGSIIFGGIDVKKFSGPLQKIPMLERDGANYAVQLDGADLSSPGKDKDTKYFSANKLPVHFQTGGSFSILPHSFMRPVCDAYLDFKLPEMRQTDTIDFRFGDAVIKVPATALFTATNFSWWGHCSFKIWAIDDIWQTGYEYRLGNDILRHAYVVYDVTHSNIYVASSANCGSKIVALDDDTDYASLRGECPSSA